MPCFVDIEAGGPEVSLYARISTPLNPAASRIDPSLPTILFCHPTWLDSFFFYPQSEDPLFVDHYNLVSFDMRGHGLTTVQGRDDDYSVWRATDDIAAGLVELGVHDVHVIGCAFGAQVAVTLASRYPAVVLSVVLVSLPPAKDSILTSLAYEECHDALVHAVNTGDYETLDAITTATFEYGVGSLSPTLREVRDEYKSLARTRLSSQDVDDTAFYIWHPVMARLPLTATDIASIKSPMLILQGVGDEHAHTEDAEEFAGMFNAVKAARGDSARATLRLVEDVGHFMTLTSPNIVNPLIAKFLNTPTSAGLPPIPETRITTPSVARRSSTPRIISQFDIPPLPRLPPGTKTIGDMLDAGVSIEIEVVTDVML